MRDRHLERLGQRINEKIDKIGKMSTNVMLINCYDNRGLTKEDTESILCKDEYIVCYHEFRSNKMSKVYEPFLNLIKEAYDKYVDVSFDEFMEECNVYKEHRTIIKSYFETGIGKRNELLFVDSIQYEIQKMYEGIASMITYITKYKPIVFVLNKLQFSGSSTMEWLNYFFEIEGIEGIAIFATFNTESAVLNGKQKVWKQLVDNFSERKSIFDWDKFGDEKIIAECEYEVQYYELTDEYVTEKLLNIQNMCVFLALSQAYYNLQSLYKKCEVQKIDISSDLKFNIYKMYIKTCAETNCIAEGFEAKDSLRKLISNDEQQFTYYVLQAFLETVNKQFSQARETICKARQMVNDNQQKQDMLDIIDYIAKVQYWKKPWQDSNLKEDELYIMMPGSKASK